MTKEPDFALWNEASQCFISEEFNAWSYTGAPGTWKPRIGNPKKAEEMAKKTKKEEPAPGAPAGKHFDEGKPRLDLFDGRFYLACGDALRYSTEKYGNNNWKGGIAFSKLIGSAERHIAKFKSGEDNDFESDLHHLAHAAINLMMLYCMSQHKPELDDRSAK